MVADDTSVSYQTIYKYKINHHISISISLSQPGALTAPHSYFSSQFLKRGKWNGTTHDTLGISHFVIIVIALCWGMPSAADSSSSSGAWLPVVFPGRRECPYWWHPGHERIDIHIPTPIVQWRRRRRRRICGASSSLASRKCTKDKRHLLLPRCCWSVVVIVGMCGFCNTSSVSTPTPTRRSP